MALKSRRVPGSPDLAQIVAQIEKARSGGRGRRSPLYRWLREHHDKLVVEFDRVGPAWDTLAAALGDGGVLDGRGKRPTGRGARDAWFRVRKDVKREKTDQGHATKTAVRLIPAPAPAPAMTPADPSPEIAEARPRPKFGPMRLRHTVAPDAGQRGNEEPPEPSEGER